MSEMIERVGKAISEAGGVLFGFSPEHTAEMARAAIEAMREPDKTMFDAAMPHMDSWSSNTAWWHSMIDAALEREKA